MRWFILAMVTVAFGLMLYHDRTQAPMRQSRLDTQDALLLELMRVGTPDARQLAEDWRNAYPEALNEQISELRLVVDRVKSNPADAASMTVRGKQKAAEKLQEQFTPVLTSPFGGSEPKPGL
ncbi:hypothetical protein H8Z72_22670 (plasmid) [Xanthomonas citri pv. citri]|uniref:hypothetical protein n=1 Tax=Xanthomonas citri TaxID=346 RepID=UPI0019312381|nr:hypothetical protein [Xanthomonas citri]QRD62666.1 hypothetical protein H8Z74_23515 [Xanthomonas citri pv. citri]QRD67201.1 hypothetical protein H8Z73_22495 [Xanthomonas citri pv. citri]QRD71754.1 hypothetical protein H8Z72_22670 [Xanthomonas citri pv. citri]